MISRNHHLRMIMRAAKVVARQGQRHEAASRSIMIASASRGMPGSPSRLANSPSFATPPRANSRIL